MFERSDKIHSKRGAYCGESFPSNVAGFDGWRRGHKLVHRLAGGRLLGFDRGDWIVLLGSSALIALVALLV
jgi:hypothetical protein